MKPLIVVTGALHRQALDLLNSNTLLEVLYAPEAPLHNLNDAFQKCRGLIVRHQPQIDAKFLDQCPQLQFICRAGAGTEHIDIRECQKRQITVTSTPGANSQSVAEHTMGLILSCSHKINLSHASIMAKEWNRHGLIGHEIAAKTLGLIGLGRIGRKVATLAHAFEMDVIAYDPFVESQIMGGLGVRHIPELQDLLRESDIVSLHVPLTTATQKIANAAFFKAMKKGSLFVNTSRGGVTDESSLVTALKSGTPAWAALDVFGTEPLSDESPLRSPDISSQLVLTPHIAGQTDEALARISVQSVENLLRFFVDGKIVNEITCQ